MERAKRFAATQVALGLDRTMISSMAVPARMAEPAVGAGFDAGRLARAIDNCGRGVPGARRPKDCARCTTRTSAGSSRPRPRSSGSSTTSGPSVIGFGPDTGHLRWAGIDPAPFIRRYADRIGGIHIKDCFPDFLTPVEPGAA